MNYNHTVGKNKGKEQYIVSDESSEFIDSLVILIDKINPYVQFDRDMLRLILLVVPEEEAMSLVNSLLEKVEVEERFDRVSIKSLKVSRLLSMIEGEVEDTERFYRRTVSHAALQSFYRSFEGKEVEDKLTARAAELIQVLGLEESDIKILTFLHVIDSLDFLEDLLCTNRLGEFFSLTSAALDIPLEKVRSALGDDGALIRAGLVEPDYLPPPHFQVDSTVTKFFRSGSVKTLLGNLTSVEGPVFPVDSFMTDAMQNDILKRLLSSEQPAHVLLYGTPGTGKTEYAKAILRHVEKSGYFLPAVEETKKGENMSRRFQLLTASKTLDPENAVLIVDEADNLLNSEKLFSAETEKGWITDFLDQAPVSIIWISNSIDETHPAVLRRFTYSIEFRPSSLRTREMVWRNLLDKSPLKDLLDEQTIKSLSRDYKVNVGGISSAIRSVSRLYANKDGEEGNKGEETENGEAGERGEETSKDVLVSRLEEMLRRHQELIGEQESTGLKPLTPAYDPSVLNTDVPIDEVVEAASSYTERMLEPAASSRGVSLTTGASLRASGAASLTASRGVSKAAAFTLLLWGEPGTGKTEFAKYLAEYLDRPLHINRASDLLSAFVGATESNIDGAFRAAEEEQAVLLLDEADSFFVDRRSAQHSWETSRTNELLTQMENFRGILVCSTNLLESMDHAVMRRFSWKIRFSPLRREDRIRLYTEIFSDIEGELSDTQRERLEKLETLTPGDLYAVYSRFGYLSAQELDHERILSALEREAAYKRRESQRSIGFVG